jgi:TRAP-type mannitol/chloroaromatic compound transport system permease large subunit
MPAALFLLARDVFSTFSSYGLTVIPLFVFMGQVSFHAGISKRLYEPAYAFIGHFRGGLPFLVVLIVGTVVLIAVPSILLVLPNLMY